MNTTKSFQAAGRGDFHRNPMEAILGMFQFFLGQTLDLYKLTLQKKISLNQLQDGPRADRLQMESWGSFYKMAENKWATRVIKRPLNGHKLNPT